MIALVWTQFAVLHYVESERILCCLRQVFCTGVKAKYSAKPASDDFRGVTYASSVLLDRDFNFIFAKLEILASQVNLRLVVLEVVYLGRLDIEDRLKEAGQCDDSRSKRSLLIWRHGPLPRVQSVIAHTEPYA